MTGEDERKRQRWEDKDGERHFTDNSDGQFHCCQKDRKSHQTQYLTGN